MSVWGDQLNGRDYNTSRKYGMSVNAPPADARWHHSKCHHGLGQDVVHTNYDTYSEFRRIRIEWLDQFEMLVTEEGDWRYWRWYDRIGQVRWWERRRLSDSLPRIPGFWPSDE